MIFENKTLEDVYKEASEYYNKSISELEIKIIQSPTKGFFGLFAKNAIIEIINEVEKTIMEENSEIDISEKLENIDIQKQTIQKSEAPKRGKSQKFQEVIELPIEEVIHLAKKEINELFELSCFNMDKIDVRIYDDETILFEIKGEDSALLIGKQGYRYNALATMIFSWISQKYGYKTRLEIASFLETEKEKVRKLLEPVIREIEEKGRYKTKPFDGVLAYLALEILREEFPHKYVAIKKNKDESQYIIVNDFLKKNG